jgi:hypothetical protein
MKEENRRRLNGPLSGRRHWLNCKGCMSVMKKKKRGLINVDLVAATFDIADNMEVSYVIDWARTCTDKN